MRPRFFFLCATAFGQRSAIIHRVETSSDVPVVKKSEGLLQIGEVAERVDLSLRSVRFYEESGLLTPEARSAGGFRLYANNRSSACC